MQFVYQAVGKSGRVVRGSTAAPSMQDLQRDLGQKGLSLISARPDLLGSIGDAFRAKKLGRGVLIDLFGYLNGLMAMGMDMNVTFSFLKDSIDDPLAKQALSSIHGSIQQGFTLSDSMAKTGVFPEMVLGNVRAGESSGNLEKVFAALETHYREEQELAGQVLKATMYPAISTAILFMIGVGLLTFVIPQLKCVFGANPPLPTAILVFLSDGVVGYWWTLPLGLVTTVVAWTRLPERAKARVWEMFYQAPVIGLVLKNLALSNLMTNLALMLNAGVSLLQTLNIVIPTIKSKALRQRLKAVKENIEHGGMFADGFNDPFFPSVVSSAIRQGEATGALGTYMQRIAGFLKERARARMHVLSSMIEPLLLVVAGGMVLFLAIGIFLPIYGSMQNIGK